MHDTIVAAVAADVEAQMSGEGSGHDWWHIVRVWNMAKTLQKTEGGDCFVIELAALLHDIADSKLHGGDEEIGPRMAREMMTKKGVDEPIMQHVCEIIATMSFHKGLQMNTLEGKIVQDADRLDAIGAIGIARLFLFGGFKQRILHDPNLPRPTHPMTEEYKKLPSTSINHFYEKILHVKDKMNTTTAKQLAADRHVYVEQYLTEFYAEWEGER